MPPSHTRRPTSGPAILTWNCAPVAVEERTATGARVGATRAERHSSLRLDAGPAGTPSTRLQKTK